MGALAAVAAGMNIAGNVIETKAKLDELHSNKQIAIESSQAEARDLRYNANKVLSQRRAVGAASGVDIASGSPLLADLDAVKNAALQEQTIKRKGKYMADYYDSQIRPTILTGFLRGGSQLALLGSNAGAFGGGSAAGSGASTTGGPWKPNYGGYR